jgi:hypothetical protein
MKMKMETEGLQDMPTLEKCPLTKAKALGQLVEGTSKGSTYVCCVLHEEFGVAIRDNGGTISLRVEPRKPKVALPSKVRIGMKQLGFGGDDPSYLSQHFKAEGGPLAGCGAYGAVIEQIKHLFGTDNVASLPWKEIVNAGN